MCCCRDVAHGDKVGRDDRILLHGTSRGGGLLLSDVGDDEVTNYDELDFNSELASPRAPAPLDGWLPVSSLQA